MVISQIWLDLFKGFKILGIIYILGWELYDVYHTYLGQIVQLEKYQFRRLKARTAELWEVGGTNILALQVFVSTDLS